MDLAAYLNTVGLPEELWDAFVDKVERGELGCSQLMVDAASGATVAVGAIAPQGDVWLLPNTACTTKSRLRALINDDNGSGLRPQLASMAAGGPLEAALEAAFWRHCKPALPRPGRGQIDETEWYIEHPLAASMKHSSAAPVAVLAPLPHSVAAELPSAAATATAASASAAGPEPQQQCQQSLEQRGVVMLWFVGHVVAGQCVSRDWVAPCSSSATLPRAGSLAWALRQLVLVAPQRWMNAQELEALRQGVGPDLSVATAAAAASPGSSLQSTSGGSVGGGGGGSKQMRQWGPLPGYGPPPPANPPQQQQQQQQQVSHAAASPRGGGVEVAAVCRRVYTDYPGVASALRLPGWRVVESPAEADVLFLVNGGGGGGSARHHHQPPSSSSSSSSSYFQPHQPLVTGFPYEGCLVRKDLLPQTCRRAAWADAQAAAAREGKESSAGASSGSGSSGSGHHPVWFPEAYDLSTELHHWLLAATAVPAAAAGGGGSRSDSAGFNDPSWVVKLAGGSRSSDPCIVGSDLAVAVKYMEAVAAGGDRVVQRYVDRPLLLAGRKFDVRFYLLVRSFGPLGRDGGSGSGQEEGESGGKGVVAFLHRCHYARIASRAYGGSRGGGGDAGGGDHHNHQHSSTAASTAFPPLDDIDAHFTVTKYRTASWAAAAVAAAADATQGLGPTPEGQQGQQSCKKGDDWGCQGQAAEAVPLPLLLPLLSSMAAGPLAEEMLQQGVDWDETMQRVHTMFRQLLTSAASVIGGPWPQHRALYGCDVLFEAPSPPLPPDADAAAVTSAGRVAAAAATPKLLEVTFSGDLTSILPHCPSFVDDVFEVLFQGESDASAHPNVVRLL